MSDKSLRGNASDKMLVDTVGNALLFRESKTGGVNTVDVIPARIQRLRTDIVDGKVSVAGLEEVFRTISRNAENRVEIIIDFIVFDLKRIASQTDSLTLSKYAASVKDRYTQ